MSYLPPLSSHQSNVFDAGKTKMSFTDWLPSNLSISGVVNQLKGIGGLLTPSTQQSPEQFFEMWDSLDFAITLVKNPIISLFINPQSITVNKNVLVNKQVTKGGFVVQFWGHDLETISVKAETGYFGLSKVPLQMFNLFKDYCYQGRYHSTKPFKSMPTISMLYEGQALRGYFNNLTYTTVQQRPYIITYDFTFTVTGKISIPIVSSIVSIVNKFAPPAQTSDDIQDQVNFAKGWGVKLY